MSHVQLSVLFKRIAAASFVLLLIFPAAEAQRRRRAPAGGGAAVVVDERLAALRDAPRPTANLIRRLGRGRFVAVAGERASGGVTYLRVLVTSRTSGWLQSEAVVRPSRAGDDARLLRLVRGSADFERLARAHLLLESFPRSALRPAALLILGDAAAEAAERLTREARRRLDPAEMQAGGAPVSSYYLNYNGLDRYRRLGVVYDFDPASQSYRYDGAAFREILRRHPHAPEADEARKRLATPAGSERGTRVSRASIKIVGGPQPAPTLGHQIPAATPILVPAVVKHDHSLNFTDHRQVLRRITRCVRVCERCTGSRPS